MRRTGLVLLLCAWLAAPAGAGDGPIRVTASLEPAAVRYGDPVAALVEVDFDANVVRTGSVRVRPSFVPYVVTSHPVVRHPKAGVVTYRYPLLCVTEGCLPTRGPRLLRLQRVMVTGEAGGRTVTASAAWPVLRISSRLAAADVSGPIRFRSPTAPPPARYRLAPGALSGALIALAALCALGALASVGRELFRIRGRRSARPPLSPFQLAVAYVRDSATRTAPDRRRALELLAEAVGERGDRSLADAAADTAWSAPPPTPAGASELADRAEGAVR